MAIPEEEGQHQQHPTPGLHHHTISNASTATVDIEAWTTSAFESLNIASIARSTGTALSIPLDDPLPESAPPRMKLRHVAPPRPETYGADIARPRSARDSMKNREALLRGKEGSRQRRRWENDHLLGVPNAQPPLASDWLVQPTHPVHGTMPYQVANYWDKGLRERVEERKAAFASHRKMQTLAGGVGAAAAAEGPAGAGARADIGKVPKDLRAKAKRTPAVKSWLRTLEEPVRQFLVDRGLVAKPEPEVVNSSDEMDTEDEEIVYVGRNGSMRDGKGWKKARREVPDQEPRAGMVLDTLGDDETGAFRRWLTHSISDYYGLDSKSVEVGNPARRVVYVGVKQFNPRHALPIRAALPPPLWEMF
ncbi:R3H-associated N-terminal domain-containing protein [Podospora appendiculata]|uniref:R3H-associated N-terminal domain-containing protein n=1 Tax=Podospora appendiculata TaxID=314037 RepID=A0AAE1CBR1_9PEZI|nr:R3H-associated N-terminal domain-containing protein [Podospora appendiculata]